MNIRATLALAAVLGITLAGTASADICTMGSKNFKLRITWSGGQTEEKSECMYSCSLYDVKIVQSDCYKSESSGTSYRYTCDLTLSGKNKRPDSAGTVHYGFSQKFNKVELPMNKLPKDFVAAAGVGCRD